jgi:hypothetical protein
MVLTGCELNGIPANVLSRASYAGHCIRPSVYKCIQPDVKSDVKNTRSFRNITICMHACFNSLHIKVLSFYSSPLLLCLTKNSTVSSNIVFVSRWHSYLTACTKTCGKGAQMRKIACRRLTTDHYRFVHDSECTQPRPTSAEPDLITCNEIACPPVYKPEPWSKVSHRVNWS